MIGGRILALRKARGLSQEELAGKLTVSRQAVSKWELGESIPDTENIIQLSRLFGVSTDFLLLDTPEEPKPLAKTEKPSRRTAERTVIALLALLLILLSLAFRDHVTSGPAEPWLNGTFVDRDQAAHGAVHLVFDHQASAYIKYRQTADDGTFVAETLEEGSFRPVSQRDGVFRVDRDDRPMAEIVYANDKLYWPNGDGTFTVFFRHDRMPVYIHVLPSWATE
jgi:transcriptional regulator with XRE-family HTH domain